MIPAANRGPNCVAASAPGVKRISRTCWLEMRCSSVTPPTSFPFTNTASATEAPISAVRCNWARRSQSGRSFSTACWAVFTEAAAISSAVITFWSRF